MTTPLYKKREKFLAAFLNYVPLYGWSQQSAEEACKVLKLDIGEYELLYPKSIMNVIEQFLYSTITELQESKIEIQNKPVREKIYLITQKWFILQSENKELIQKLTEFYALPNHWGAGISDLWQICSTVWHMAGDQSLDYNYYTKRALLEMVFVPTLLYWLQDESRQHEETWLFLHKRIENIINIGMKVKYLNPKNLIKKIPYLRLLFIKDSN